MGSSQAPRLATDPPWSLGWQHGLQWRRGAPAVCSCLAPPPQLLQVKHCRLDSLHTHPPRRLCWWKHRPLSAQRTFSEPRVPLSDVTHVRVGSMRASGLCPPVSSCLHPAHIPLPVSPSPLRLRWDSEGFPAFPTHLESSCIATALSSRLPVVR